MQPLPPWAQIMSLNPLGLQPFVEATVFLTSRVNSHVDMLLPMGKGLSRQLGNVRDYVGRKGKVVRFVSSKSSHLPPVQCGRRLPWRGQSLPGAVLDSSLCACR